MGNYIITLNPIIKEYFKILSPDGIPDFLYDYINTKEMQRIGKVSTSCGTNYTKIFNHKFIYSNLEHSIGVALIIWNFTKDKKQTLAGLFHDISTPTFKHCIDFMNGDHEKQESTEELTSKIISNSKEIMELLNRDGIKLEDVDNYKLYPIADNDTPKLSSDRLEYTFSNGLFFKTKDIWKLKEIKEIYDDIEVLKNEDGIDELGFKTKEIAEEYIKYCRKIWPFWIDNDDVISMQFIADIVKKMSDEGYITKKDLYTLSDAEVIKKIENCEDKHIAECFKKFENTDTIYETDDEPKTDCYYVSIKAKRRYNIPLVKTNGEAKRINEISELAKNTIDDYLQYSPKKYVAFDFKF